MNSKIWYSLGEVMDAFRKAGGSAERFALELTRLSRINPADVAGITLLSKEEYLDAKDIVPRLDSWWWLRSPGCFSYTAAFVGLVGGVGGGGNHVGNSGGSVRPALRLKPESWNLSIGDRFLAAWHTWTVITGNLALCDDSIGRHCFRKDWEAPDANVYETSDVKRFLETWAQENGLLPKEVSPQDIAGITIPSKEEYLEAKDIVLRLDGWWWLRTPGYRNRYGTFVDGNDGHVHDYLSVPDTLGVRPALRLDPESGNFQIGDKIQAAEKTWTVIPGDLALCDEFIGEHCFREDWRAPDANVYEASDVKHFVEDWAREHGLPV